MNIVSFSLLFVNVILSGISYTYEQLMNGAVIITSADVPQSITEVNIPDTIDGNNVYGIESYSFAGQVSAEKVTIPDTVTYIGDSAFMSCTSLKEVVVGSRIHSLPDDCFFACPALETVSLPETLNSIGNETFFGCDMLDLYIPQNVTSIGENAFGVNTDPHTNENINVYGFLVKGVTGSYAETYSVNNNIDFIDMNNYNAGDVNNDGFVDASDASSILEEYSRISTGNSPAFTKKQTILGDVDLNNMVDAGDASAVLEIYSRLSTN